MTAEVNSGARDELQGRGLLSAENAAPIERLTSLLQEAEQQHHGRPAAGWPRWYAAFVNERQLGASVGGAEEFADRYTAGQRT
jgi:hypothetical protein